MSPAGLDRISGDSIAGNLAAMRAMVVRQVLAQHYDAGGINRRTHGWSRVSGDPNAISGYSIQRLANYSRDLVRNNGHAQSALQVIRDDVVGWGIRPSVNDPRWTEWADSQNVDADGRFNLAGFQDQAMRTIVESGAVIIRRRRRRLSDGLALPLQLQILEPDFIDTSQHRTLPNGGRIIRGIEFSPIGERVAYWMFREHPGSTLSSANASIPVPADSILHIFRPERPGQVHGIPWFAPILMRFRDFDEYADATLLAKKIQAAFAGFVFDLEGSALGKDGTQGESPEWDFIEPGSIRHLPIGGSVTFPSLPQVRDHESYSSVTLREIAAGIGVTYEDMTGNYAALPFSAARLSRLRHWGRVCGWRWRMLIPQMLDGVWSWSVDAAALAGFELPAKTDWTAPGLAMIEPDKEGLAIMRNIRAGITTYSDEIRARGFNVNEFLDELQADFEEIDRRGLILDSDPRKMTQAGQLQGAAATAFDQANAAIESFIGKLPADLQARILQSAAREKAA